jgi:hypothetical protein
VWKSTKLRRMSSYSTNQIESTTKVQEDQIEATTWVK